MLFLCTVFKFVEPFLELFERIITYGIFTDHYEKIYFIAELLQHLLYYLQQQGVEQEMSMFAIVQVKVKSQTNLTSQKQYVNIPDAKSADFSWNFCTVSCYFYCQFSLLSWIKSFEFQPL